MSRIQITCDTPGAEIYYSINNDNLDQLYTIPFEMNEGGEIYAIGRKNGMEESGIESKEVIKLPTPVTILELNSEKEMGFKLTNINDYTSNHDFVEKGYFQTESEFWGISTSSMKEVLENENFVYLALFLKEDRLI